MILIADSEGTDHCADAQADLDRRFPRMPEDTFLHIEKKNGRKFLFVMHFLVTSAFLFASDLVLHCRSRERNPGLGNAMIPKQLNISYLDHTTNINVLKQIRDAMITSSPWLRKLTWYGYVLCFTFFWHGKYSFARHS